MRSSDIESVLSAYLPRYLANPHYQILRARFSAFLENVILLLRAFVRKKNYVEDNLIAIDLSTHYLASLQG